MKRNRLIGGSLFICSIAIIIGMIIEVPVYWFIVDLLVMTICLISGILIWRNKV